jgi:hypothetical protein
VLRRQHTANAASAVFPILSASIVRHSHSNQQSVLDVCHPLSVRGVGVFGFGSLLLNAVAASFAAATATSCATTAAATSVAIA